ncbi:MAG TPA: DoxX family membrane protein [Gemmatimonadaceae bacterium]
MTAPPQPLQRIDVRLTNWMARYGLTLLRITLGLVFFWFGVLKFSPGLSPADALAARTIETLSGGMLQRDVSVPLLAVWESVIGLGLLFGRYLRVVLLLLGVQMMGTLTPLFLFPEETFAVVPFVPTLEGQYIVKNAVLISAAIVLGATVRGGGLVAQAHVKQVGEELGREEEAESRHESPPTTGTITWPPNSTRR